MKRKEVLVHIGNAIIYFPSLAILLLVLLFQPMQMNRFYDVLEEFIKTLAKKK